MLRLQDARALSSSVPTLLAQKPNQPHKLCQPSGTSTTTLEESLGKSQLPKEPYHPSCRQSDQLPVAEQQVPVAQQTTLLLRTIAIENKFKDVLQVRCNYESCNFTELKTDDINVKGRLREHLTFWEEIGTYEMILSVISQGYTIPFIRIPPAMRFHNNKSALKEHSFVSESILELLQTGRITEKFQPSYIISPLSVACQTSNKEIDP